METNARVKPPTWFWVLGILALLWNLMGVSAYLKDATMGVEDLEKLTQAQRLLYESTPAWVTGAFAIAVWGGLLGCIALLLRKKWARPVFVVSFVAIVVQTGYSLFMSDSLEVYGPGGAVLPVLVVVIGILLVLFSQTAERRKWIS